VEPSDSDPVLEESVDNGCPLSQNHRLCHAPALAAGQQEPRPAAQRAFVAGNLNAYRFSLTRSGETPKPCSAAQPERSLSTCTRAPTPSLVWKAKPWPLSHPR
jgi:hypothetical protein